MGPVDYLIIFIVAAILGFAIGYIRKAKKAGVKCVGCPNAKNCSGNCGDCGN